jgi:hypothetical protein
MAGAAGETRKLRPIPRRSDDEAALLCRHGHDLRPIGQSLDPELDNERLGAFGFAPGRQHAPGIE